MALPRLLIVGATGRQGRAVIEALVSQSAQFEILALTRNPSSVEAQKLASKANITILESDSSLIDFSPIFEAYNPIYGVLCVTSTGKHGDEERQAKPLINESLKNSVKHFVFCSVDRGLNSEENPTNIPHFIAKYNIELYLKEQLTIKNSSMEYTILRPTAFMENLSPDFMGKAFSSMWRALGDKPLQLIAVRDIGLFGAKAFLNPDEYTGREFALAGDDLTFEQAKKAFKETLGYDMPETYWFVGSALKWIIGEVGLMFTWFKNEGYAANIPVLRMEEPLLQNFGTWLKESSGFREQ